MIRWPNILLSGTGEMGETCMGDDKGDVLFKE